MRVTMTKQERNFIEQGLKEFRIAESEEWKVEECSLFEEGKKTSYEVFVKIKRKEDSKT